MYLEILQIVGGVFFFLNKVFFSFAERSKSRKNLRSARKFRIWSWVAYLVGLPPWILVYANARNWIAASIEASGTPALILGLYFAVCGTNKDQPKLLDYLALICIPFGFVYSLKDFGGFNTWNQVLEVGVVVGFLPGTYLLAKERPNGYLLYIVMHVSCALLMYIQGCWWLAGQQIFSLVFIVDAYMITQRLTQS